MTRCKDCRKEGISTHRPAPFAGPRCATHARAEKRRRGARAHERHIEVRYKITPEQYQVLYAAQDGRCFICRKAKGISRRLTVEHEHDLCDDHPSEYGCPRCIRALTCRRCNELVAFLDVEALQRAIQLLLEPPARRILQDS